MSTRTRTDWARTGQPGLGARQRETLARMVLDGAGTWAGHWETSYHQQQCLESLNRRGLVSWVDGRWRVSA